MIILEKEQICSCVSKHVPLPIYLVKYEEEYLCPSSYYNLLSLLEEFNRYGGTPPGWVCKHYSPFVRNLATLSYYGK